MANKIPLDLERALGAMEIGALDVIVKKRQPRHFKALLDLVSLERDVVPEHRQRAMYALGRWGDSAGAEPILEVLDELDEAETCTAVDSLGRLGTAEAQKAVERCSEHASPQVRKFAIRALGRIGGSAAETRLRQIAREDPELWVRDVTARVLEGR